MDILHQEEDDKSDLSSDSSGNSDQNQTLDPHVQNTL